MTLVLHHLPGKADNNILFQFAVDLLFPLFPILQLDYLCQSCINGLVGNNNLVDRLIVQIPVIRIESVQLFHRPDRSRCIIGFSEVITVREYSLFHNAGKLFNGLRDNVRPFTHGIVFPDRIGSEACVCTVDQLIRAEHINNFLLERNGTQLFVLRTGIDTHGDRYPVSVHKESHLHNGIWTVLLAGAVFPQTAQHFTGHRIDIDIVFLFAFKEVIRTVKITNCLVPFYNVIAVDEQMLQGRYEEGYLLQIRQNIIDRTDEYRKTYDSCIQHLEKMTSSSIEHNVLKTIGSAGKSFGNLLGGIQAVKGSQVNEWFTKNGESIKQNGEEYGRDALKQFETVRDPGCDVFIDNITQVNRLYNETQEIYIDSENIYLV